MITEHLSTPVEVARILRLSEDTVYRIFEREKGVLMLESASRLSKPKAEAKRLGRYRTLRIPEVVLRRVLERYRVQ